MKIDRTQTKKSSSEVPFDCKLLIEELKSCDEEQLFAVLKRIKTWSCGKCELFHWIDVLDIFDSILEECCRKESPEQWVLPVDKAENSKKRDLLLAVISFTSLLIEHSYSRHLYNSIEHLITLLSSTDMQIVLAILNLLFVFSKRSNFFQRINTDIRTSLLKRVYNLAKNWGGKEQGFSLALCCQDLPLTSYPSNAVAFNYEYYSNDTIETTKSKGKDNCKKSNIVRINIENISEIDKPISELMAEMVETYKIPPEEQIKIFTKLRLIKNFSNFSTRLQCVQARLNALSIIVYCNSMSMEFNASLISNALIEEIIEVLELKSPDLIEIKSASLKALTSIIHLDRDSKLKLIIDSTGANSYHGFLPILVRNCVNSLITDKIDDYPLSFVTALFSFLYHFASYDTGCEALIQCGIKDSLSRVVEWKGTELDHLTFVTRAVRVIDLLTNQFIDLNFVQNNNGLNIFIQRLEYEVNICRVEQPFEIEVSDNKGKVTITEEDIESLKKVEDENSETPMEVEIVEPPTPPQPVPSTSKSTTSEAILQCHPQRAALLKSMLNFLKRAVQCSGFSENIRPLMYGNFPRSLRHIISNAEYYGSSLFLLATDVVSVYVYQEPSLLSVAQDNGLTDVVMHALLVKDVPPTKEVLTSLPQVFTSLCLNNRGLRAFIALRPFERLFKIFLSPDYLQAMRRRRSESIGDTATCLGNAMDELMRHQPSLRVDVIRAIIKLLEQIDHLGSDPKYICTRAASKSSSVQSKETKTFNNNRNMPAPNVNNDSSSSEDEEEEDDDTTTSAEPAPANNEMIIANTPDDSNVSFKIKFFPEEQIPLIDYILNVMKFLDAILSKNSTPDHCHEFLNQNGLDPLFKLLQLPNLPLDFPSMQSCYAIAGVFKSLINLTHERSIFAKGLEKLKEILEKLEPLAQHVNGSFLLEDLINNINSKKIVSSNFVTPMLKLLSSAHSYIILFNHVCRTGQGDIRLISIDQWGSDLGIEIINLLSRLYIILVWESTLLLGLNNTSQKYESVKAQIEKLNGLIKNNTDIENAVSPMEVDFDTELICSNCGRPDTIEKKNTKPFNSSKAIQQKYLKPLLAIASRLGRSLAELFALMVKLCVGTIIRRRNHHPPQYYNYVQTPTKQAINIAKHLNILLYNGLIWKPNPDINIPKFSLTFYVCSIGFTSPLLFDDKKSPYHLMLKNFVLKGGQDAFFDCLKMAFEQYSEVEEESLETSNSNTTIAEQSTSNQPSDSLPSLYGINNTESNSAQTSSTPLNYKNAALSSYGLLEFLDSWLLLLEKMTNPTKLIDSPHAYAIPKTRDSELNNIRFDPFEYLITTYKKAFPCIMDLWNNNKFYSVIRCNRAIETLITIFSHIIKGEKIIEKNLKKSTTNVSDANTSTSSGERNFWSENNRLDNANLQTLVEMGFPRRVAIEAIMANGDDVNAATEWILQNNLLLATGDSEEDDMLRAIRLSLNDSGPRVAPVKKTVEEKEIVADDSKSKEEKMEMQFKLNKEELDNFTNNILPGILRLIDQVPDIIQSASNLLIAILKRNGNKWFEEMLMQLIDDIINNILDLINHTQFIQSMDSKALNDWVDQLSTLPEANKLTARIHLLLYLFKETNHVCAKQLNSSTLMNYLIELLGNASNLLKVVYEKDINIKTPKWVPLIILLIDLYEKIVQTSTNRKSLLTETMNTKRTWRFFDERTSRWSAYQAETNKLVDDAFRNSESECRITLNRRKYTIKFEKMCQQNDETLSVRPIMLFIDEKCNKTEKSDKEKDKEKKDDKGKEEKGKDDSKEESKDKKKNKDKIEYEIEQQKADLEMINELSHINSLNSSQIDSILESMITLMQLPVDSHTSDALIRLCLRLTTNYQAACSFVEKNGINALLNITRASLFQGYVPLVLMILRHLLEDPEAIKILMDKVIRLQMTSVATSREMHDLLRNLSPLAHRNREAFKNAAMNLLRINTPLFNARARLNDDERTGILLRLVTMKNGEQSDNQIYETPKITKDVIGELLNLLPIRHVEQIKYNKSREERGVMEEECPTKKLFQTANILLFLGEITKAYNFVAKIICEHTYPIGYIDSIMENCSALSFILDNLLPHSPNCGDKESASYAQVLLSTIASVPFCNEIHNTLIAEIKTALGRAVCLPELVEKHDKIQALTSLIMGIVEAQTLHHKPNMPLNSCPVFKLLIRKNLVADFAKVIQSLDLSSPFMPNTVNQLLKTLEYLSKTLNSQQNTFNNRPRNERTNESSNAFSIPVISLSTNQSTNNVTIMEQDHSENLTNNSANNQDSAINQTVSENTNAIDEQINRISNALDNSNVDENTENELFLDSVAYDFNAHPRTGTFNSDEVRTDDDDDDEQNAILDAVNDHTEMHDNVVNSNVVELSGDDTDSDDSDEDSDDVEMEEEDEDDEDDAAGSTQDEEDEEEGNIDDEEEDMHNDIPLHTLFDVQPDNEIVLNIEEIYPGSQHDRYQHILPFRPQDDTPINIDNSARNSSLSTHPLLNNVSDNSVSNPIAYSTPIYVGSSSNLSGNYIPPLARIQRTPRHRSYRYFQTNNNWHVTHVHSRNHTTQILQRLLGSSSSQDFLTGFVRNTAVPVNRDQDGFNDDFYDPFNVGIPYTSNATLLQSIMNRLAEESRTLDGIFLHDSMLLVKTEIIKHLEKLREEEMAKCPKKEEAMDITNDYKNTNTTENTNTTTNSNNINAALEIQAHIEQLTNSVINQVLETNPTANAVNQTNEPSANQEPAILDPENNSFDASVVDIEVVEEALPMAINENSPELVQVPVPVDSETSNNSDQSVQLMEQSTQEQSESVAATQPAENAVTENEIAPTPNPQPTYNLTPEERAILGDQELPEGVDPSFLAALPENIRQEVIAEQFRLQRANALIEQPQSTTANAAPNSSSGHTFAEVNPEFLAALPPNIQEEVLAQQRAEQQRVNAQNANPDTPMDATSFFHSLPPSLRRQILADLDDSQVQLLPAEYAHEARLLRREYELRNRQMHERIFQSNSTISRIIRTGVSSRYDTLNIPLTFTRFHIRSSNGENRDYLGSQRNYSRSINTRSVKGRYLLDHDALSSILILLFIQDNTINITRLHRLIKNLCFHGPTRQWIIQALLDIMEKTKDSNDQNLLSNSFLNSDDQSLKNITQNHSWLSITLNSSFGSRTNVFIVNKVNATPSAKKTNCVYTISINRQASLFVCSNVLEVLVFLARSFPDQFISFSNMTSGLQKNPSATSLNNSVSSLKDATDPQQSPVAPATPTSFKTSPGFFDVLMRHDFIHTKKTKSKQATNSSNSPNVEIDSTKSDYSPFFQLLNLLSHHFIKKSPTLTTMLIRLMTCITTSLISDNRTPVNLSNEIKEKLNEIEKTIANERLLRMVVDVLVSKTCSEEGLGDATSLLIKLSTIFPQCRKIFYKLLLKGAKVLGEVVYSDINQLLLEMDEFLCKLKLSNPQDGEQLEKNTKGQTSVQDRYSNTTIVINQSNVKHISGKEVQLPSMSSLISKSSNQFLLLRILKIVMHIREINAKNRKDDEVMECDYEDKLCTELELDHLWEKLSECLSLLSEAPDDHVVLVLQPAVESFFLVHAPEKAKASLIAETANTSNNRSTSANEALTSEGANDGENRQYSSLPADTQKFLIFAEKHRFVLNQILRQSTVHLAHGPFAVLVDHTRVLDFDVKRRYFRQQLERSDNSNRRDDLAVHIRREHVFEDSYRELNRRTASDWKNRFYIVFEGEEGQDAGGLLREWYTIISREIFNPNYALFTTSPGDRVTYMINSASHCNSNHLSYFKFVGRVIGKAIHDNKLLDCYFTRSFYKHILGKAVKYTDMESEDYAFYQGLVFLLEHNVNELGTELTFSLEIQEFGVTEVRDLVPNGRNIIVTEENKHDYVKLVCQEKMTGSIKKQLNSFLEGFYEIIPKNLISIFNEHELELFISGLPTIDIDDLKANTDYHKYVSHSLQIQWFWRALRSFDQADRAKFLQFVTGTSKVPLQGFSALEGMNGPQKFQIHLDDRSTDRLPSAHTCFNQLDLPQYETYDKLRLMLLKAIHECSEGFGFA